MLPRSKDRIKYSAVFIAAAFFMLVITAATAQTAFSAAGSPRKVRGLKVKGVNYRAVTVTFNPAEGAEKYEIFRASAKDGKYRKVKTTRKTAVKISGLRAGRKYYFKVRGINGKLAGKDSRIVSGMTKLDTPVVNVAADPSGISVSWNKIPGAKGYLIYRKAAGGSKQLIRKIKGYGTRTYKDVNVVNLKKYKYAVCAYCGQARSKTSRAAGTYYYAVPEQAEMLAPTVENSGICLNWKSAANAFGYDIYRRKHGTAEAFVCILNVSYKSNSAIDRTAETDQAYDYYVTAVNHGLTSAASQQVSARKLAAPHVRCSVDEIGAEISWDHLDGVTAYKIYRFDSKGAGTEIAEIEYDASAEDPEALLNYTEAFTPANGAKYTYGVKAVMAGDPVVSESGISQKSDQFLTAPKKLTVYYANDSSLTIGFKINKKASGQQVQISETADFTVHQDIEINNLRTYLGTFPDLAPASKYYIRARNYIASESGTRSWSAWSKGYKAYTKEPGMEEGTRISDEAVNEVVEKAITWIDGKISVLDTSTAKVLGAAAWQDDEHFSCSTLVTKGYRHAGVKLPTWFFSSKVAKNYLANGFIEVTDQVNTKTGAGLKRGDVLLNKRESHTGMYLGYFHGQNNMMINATKKHWTTKYNGASYSWKRVFRYAGK